MAVHLWTIVSQRSLVDAQSNNATIVDVLEQITIPPPPKTFDTKKRLVLPVPVSVTTLWRREKPDTPEKFKMRLVLKAPNGKAIVTVETPVDMHPHLRYRVTSRLNGFPFSGDGTYRFDIETFKGRKWRRADRQYVELIFSKEPVKVPQLKVRGGTVKLH